jgi:hypothetical protein
MLVLNSVYSVDDGYWSSKQSKMMGTELDLELGVS